MSDIHDRLEDAILLWKNEHHKGALLNALIAVAATARRRYPNCKDGEAFQSFIRDNQTPIHNVEFRGECRPLEEIFYKWLRCQLVHEAGLPDDIQFVPDSQPGAMSIRAGGAPKFVLILSYSWFNYFIRIVSNAAENKAIN